MTKKELLELVKEILKFYIGSWRTREAIMQTLEEKLSPEATIET